VQVVGIPVADEFGNYLDDFAKVLRSKGVRVEIDHSDNRMQKKIRDHTMAKVPFMILAGARDLEQNTVSFRFRDGRQDNDVPLEQALQIVLDAIASKQQV
jgi:threonyl-tRNA synthetase